MDKNLNLIINLAIRFKTNFKYVKNYYENTSIILININAYKLYLYSNVI